MEIGNTNLKFRGRYKVYVVDSATKEVVEERDWAPNLFLNQGMNGVATKLIANLNLRCCVGTGTTDTKLDSGVITASQTGTTVTASAGIFVAGDVGNVIKWDSGEESFITVYNSDTSVTVTPSQSVASDEFTIYRTNQTGLGTEVKRTGTYLTGSPNTESTRSGNTFTNRRTFDFTAESGSVSYTELGLSDNASAGANLNFRIKFSSPVALVSGQQLRITHDFIFTLGPTTSVALNPVPVTNWPVAPATDTNGDFQLEDICVSKVTTAGSTSAWNFTALGSVENSNEPSVDSKLWLSSVSTALNTWPGAVNGTTSSTADSGNLTKDAYVTNSFTITKTGVLGTSNGNGTADRRSLGYGIVFTSDTSRSAARILFDQAQTKSNVHIFTAVWRWTWTRVLS